MYDKLKPLSTLAIGSVPFESTEEALGQLALLDIPAYPQMVALSPWEDMIMGAVHGLPAILVDEKTRTVTLAEKGREEAMARFYEQFLSGDYDFLELGEKSSLGFRAFLKRAKETPGFGPGFLKSQVVGPLTFGQSVKVEGGYNLVDDPALLEMASQAIGGKAAWEAQQIRALGREPIIFIDEPGLTGYGSAFSTLTPEMVISVLGGAIETAKSKGPVMVGCHVCGNTDWGLMMKVGLDIINFDAFGFMEEFSLYPSELSAFLKNGGWVAWGIVPTSSFDQSITAGVLAERLRSGWKAMVSQGLDYELIKSRALLTTSCGLGSLTKDQARSILTILSQLAAELS